MTPTQIRDADVSGPMPRNTDGLSSANSIAKRPEPYPALRRGFPEIPDDSQEDSPSHGDPTVRYSGEEPQRLPLDQQSITIGSDPKSDLFLELGL